MYFSSVWRRELHYLVYGAVRGVDRSVSERHFLVYLSVPLQSHYAYRACEVARVDVETVELIDSRYILRAYQSLEVVIVDLLLLVADLLEALEILVELFLRQDETELRETLLKRVSARVLAQNDLRRLFAYVPPARLSRRSPSRRGRRADGFPTRAGRRSVPQSTCSAARSDR